MKVEITKVKYEKVIIDLEFPLYKMDVDDTYGYKETLIKVDQIGQNKFLYTKIVFDIEDNVQYNVYEEHTVSETVIYMVDSSKEEFIKAFLKVRDALLLTEQTL